MYNFKSSFKSIFRNFYHVFKRVIKVSEKYFFKKKFFSKFFSSKPLWQKELIMKSKLALVILFISIFITACGGGGGGSNTVTVEKTTYTIGGNVSGLDKGNSVVLQNNGGEDVTVTYTADKTSVGFEFPTKVATGSAYAVSVKTQPLGRSCSVTNGTGTITSSAVTNVTVACVSAPVEMPTLADYGTIDPVNGNRYEYLLQQTGSVDTGTNLVIKSGGSVFFLGEKYPDLASFFNDEGTVFFGQPCELFPLYVGKSGNCTRLYKKKDDFGNLVSTGTDTRYWNVDSVVSLTLLGKIYKGIKIVYIIENSIEGQYTWNRIYVPDLKLFFYDESVKADGSFSQKLLLSTLP